MQFRNICLLSFSQPLGSRHLDVLEASKYCQFSPKVKLAG